MSELNFSPDLSSDEGRVSYGIGRQLGGQLRDNPPPGVDLTAILAGLTDAFSGQAEARVLLATLLAHLAHGRRSSGCTGLGRSFEEMAGAARAATAVQVHRK